MAEREIDRSHGAGRGGEKSDGAPGMAVILPGDEEQRAASEEKTHKDDRDDDISDDGHGPTLPEKSGGSQRDYWTWPDRPDLHIPGSACRERMYDRMRWGRARNEINSSDYACCDHGRRGPLLRPPRSPPT